MKPIKLLIIILVATSCVATKYVPKGETILNRNKLKINAPKGVEIDKLELKEYLQQNPNRKLLGTNFYLGIYNITDTTKNNWWHNFWGKKVGEAPVIFNPKKVNATNQELKIYLESLGFLNAEIIDSITTNDKRKTNVTYNIKTQKPFKISSIKYKIDDDFIEPIILKDTINSILKNNTQFKRTTLENERIRITQNLRNQGFWGFNQTYINYIADSTNGNNTVDLTITVGKFISGQTQNGENIYTNHPIYRLRKITLNSNYDPTLDHNNNVKYDSIRVRGVDITYQDKLLIKEKILLDQLGMSPGELYDQKSIEQTYTNMRSLGFNPSIIFSPVANEKKVTVTTLNNSATTTQRELDCSIQCIPLVRQNFSIDFEASTTEDYFSLALRGGYQNRNIFRGAEVFTISARGAYEILWNSGKNNSFELGVSTSISAPRFWLPISAAKMRGFAYSSSKISLSFSRQRRPDYDRSIYSAVFGYGWTMKNGARFTINPADINVVSVPRVEKSFIDNISNPYLKNSYEDQLISGLSASYYYTTNSELKKDGFTFRVTGDINGNLLYGINSLFGSKKRYNEKTDSYYYHILGLQYAQYARIMSEVSNRINLGERSQIAWRVLMGLGYAYGNSQIVPFERLYFAGGSNSMRGWQVRTLGPGGVGINNYGSYPNQLGDMKLEANFEYRVNVYGGLGLAFFLDSGNIWMNSKGEDRSEARFKFSEFYKQLALNTGVGIRYDFDFFLLRLDWGIKLHNPNNNIKPWLGDLRLNDTALHFAIGLPF